MTYFLILGFLLIGVAFIAILVFAFLPSKVMGDIIDRASKGAASEASDRSIPRDSDVLK